ncbi:MAG: glycosyltransferase family 4 protein [Candidatus Desulforudis sp.]|nr:glycosyltransferase family 4 protein [Desulforudis sp.]
MRVLMLSWEYPPKTIGGLAQHVYDLNTALNREGVEVHLLTCAAPGSPDYEVQGNIHIHRVNPFQISTGDFTTWVLQLNCAMLERAISLFESVGNFRLVHAHDWLVAYAARAIKHAKRLPLVATIHATEFGRHNGLHNSTQNYISNVEWWLTYEAWRVIVCSKYMEGELKYIFQLPSDKIRVIPNGVDPENFKLHRNNRLRRDFYAAPEEKIVFYVGRLVREKGVQVLLEGAPRILSRMPHVKFIIGGKGPHEGELRSLAAGLGIASKVYFTGYIDDQVRNALYHWADVAVFPSLYEPFGIVVLEAMAARTPVITSDTGGITEIIEHRVDGLKVPPGDSRALADSIMAVLREPTGAKMLQERAFRKIREQYDWQKVARQTIQVYREVWNERQAAAWSTREERAGRILGRVYQLFERYS